MTAEKAFTRSLYYRRIAEAAADERTAAQLLGAANLFLKMSQDLYRATDMPKVPTLQGLRSEETAGE